MKFKTQIVSGILLISAISFAAGVVTPFVDVDMGTILQGVPTPVRARGGEGLLLFNKDDRPIHVHVSVAKPILSAGKRLTQAIPDPKWVTVIPEEAVIAAHGQLLCQITVTVPKQTPPTSHRYEARIVTSFDLSSKSAVRVQGALASRLRFGVN